VGDTVGAMVAELIRKYNPQTIVGIAMGSVHLAYAVARYLGIRNIFTERDKKSGNMSLRRGFHISPGEKMVIVEDVITTGGSVKEVLNLLKGMGGNVLSVASIVYRGKDVDFGIPFHYLTNLDFPIYNPEDCPLCRDGIPASKPGSKT